ncbi:MAG: hypothetical protein KAS36_15915 [Anaerolineales bacterium]|nr:hypothetical protein [Anaerolineales bacterium]
MVMDDALRNISIWLYISVVSLLGVGLIWVASVATFWMLPPLVDPPTVTTILGLVVRGIIWSIVSAAWSFIGVLGYRRLEKDLDKLVERVDS